jgi:hypothetical protein
MSLSVDDLIAIEEIKRLKYKYVRCLDQKRWDEIAECFVPDAVASYGGGAWAFDGRDAIVEFLRSSMGSQQFLSAHRVGQPEIDVTGPDTAAGTWALMDLVLQLEFGVDIRGAAFYEDTYVKVDGAWKIKSTGYKRTYEELQPRAAEITLTAHLYDTEGRSSLGG